MKRFIAVLFSVFALSVTPAFADDHKNEAKGPPAGEPVEFVSRDRVTINGRSVEYDVIAKETFLLNGKDEPEASIFSFSYIKTGENDPTKRPVMFVFNGGPGSASLWLHMGTYGPKRVVVPSDAEDDGSPPYPIVDNPGSILDATDLVFIDPVGTGFSRALGDQNPKEYFGVREDAEVISRFIRRWLTENKRWGSPKYLSGESYGTTRAGALIGEMTGRYNDVAFNGVILVSAIMDFEMARGHMGYVGALPTQAAIAWHHNRVDRSAWNNDFERFIEESRQFAARDLATALLMQQGLSEAEMDATIARYSAFTGLSETYARRARLRTGVGQFMKELLRDQSLTVGRFDGRYTGRDADDIGETADADPSGYAMDAAYTAAINDYMTRMLGIEMNRDYAVLSYDVNRSWKSVSGGGSTGPGFTNVVPQLAKGMRENRSMRVLLASGYYDQATPFFAAELSLQQPGVPQDRVEKTYYPAGHMMYLHEPSLIQLGEDIRDFVNGS